MSLSEFTDKFSFNPALAYRVGAEREFFLIDKTRQIVPRAVGVIGALHGRGYSARDHFGFELSACQIEYRTAPTPLSNLENSLNTLDDELESVLAQQGLYASSREVAPASMPYDIYPDPLGRYQTHVEKMPRAAVQAACRIIGTHVHIGMPNAETALIAYNRAINYAPRLWRMGDHSHGLREQLYRVVAPNYRAPAFASWDDFYEDAERNSYTDDPRNNWREIRISRFGTIEFRMFGTTENVKEIGKWAYECRKICLADE